MIAYCYGPNTDDPEFFRVLWGRILDIGSTHVVWLGDFNVTLDPSIDCSHLQPHHYSNAHYTLNHILTDHHLVDAWRNLHPHTREGSYFSTAHSSWSRIDNSKGLTPWLTQASYLPRTYSDHSPVLLTLSPPHEKSPYLSWRLPTHALLDPIFQAELEQEILEFFPRNEHSVTQCSTVWEAFKVTIRGICIAKGGGILKDIRITLHKLENDIREAETQTQITPTPTVQKHLWDLIKIQLTGSADSEGNTTKHNNTGRVRDQVKHSLP